VRKKIILFIVAAAVLAAIALVAYLAGGDILATAKRHLSGLGL
jgi:hypothetical protein